MTEAVVWLAVWAVVMFAATPVSYLLFGFLGMLLGAVTDRDELGAVIGVVLGWLIGLFLAVFALVQVILQIISVVQLASG